MMKTLSLSALLLLSSSLAFAQSTTCPQQFEAGEAPDLIRPALTEKTFVLCYEAFALEHSGMTRTPIWSAEHLTAASLQKAKAIPRHNDFHPENRLPSPDRAEQKDYKGSGYDRGHMSPSGDMPTTNSQDESFTLANMIPQDRNNNENLWEGIEAATRTLTGERGELYIVTGPIYDPARAYTEKLNNRVAVPTGIFKAVYDPGTKQAAAYLVPNRAGMEYQTLSIAELEKIIGISVFPKLDNTIKNTKMDLPVPTPHSEGKPTSRHGHHHDFR